MEKGRQHYQYLTLIAMLYMTLKLSTILLIYKVITVYSISFTASTLVMPFWFFLGTLVTETYGYRVARHLIWMAIICQFVFVLICTLLIHSYSPDWVNQAAYDEIFGRLPRVVLASFLAILCGAFANAYSLAKYKLLSRGHSFWLRGLKSSVIGELIFTVIAYVTEFTGLISSHHLLSLMLVSFFVKLVLSIVLVLPCVAISHWLKRVEGVDIYDDDTNFNPFSLRLNDAVNRDNNDCSNVIDFNQRHILNNSYQIRN